MPDYAKVQLAYSNTPGAVPTNAFLDEGEVAINTADGIVYYKNSSGNVAKLIEDVSNNDAKYTQNRFDITGLTGGTATDLDSITTASDATRINTTILIIVSNNPQIWRLRSGTDSEDGTYIVRPDDYAGSTNEKIWERLF